MNAVVEVLILRTIRKMGWLAFASSLLLVSVPTVHACCRVECGFSGQVWRRDTSDPLSRESPYDLSAFSDLEKQSRTLTSFDVHGGDGTKATLTVFLFKKPANEWLVAVYRPTESVAPDGTKMMKRLGQAAIVFDERGKQVGVAEIRAGFTDTTSCVDGLLIRFSKISLGDGPSALALATQSASPFSQGCGEPSC